MGLMISLGGTRDAHKCKDGGTPGVTSATAPPTVEQDKLLGRSLMEIATRQTNTKRKCPNRCPLTDRLTAGADLFLLRGF